MTAAAVLLRAACKDSTGSTAIEYALIASAIALAISIPLIVLGDGISATYEVIGSLLTLI
jgi:Flp pilus assembly pilin Flp